MIISPTPLAVPPPPITITGKVSTPKGEPLAGVTIVIKGTTKGTISDANGNYKLQVNASDKALVFSFVGLKKQEVIINGRTAINVVMEEEIANLQEVQIVSTGYQKIKKYQLTGAASVMNTEQYQQRVAVTGNFLGKPGRRKYQVWYITRKRENSPSGVFQLLMR